MSVMCFALCFERHTRRLVVDCGRPSVVAIFSWPTPAIFSMAKSSSAERTILVLSILLNMWDVRQLMLWCLELVSCARLCVGVKCRNNLLFCHTFYSGAIFSSQDPKLQLLTMVLGSLSPYDISQEKEIDDSQSTGKKGPRACGGPCISWCQNERDGARNRRMDSTRSSRRWATLHSRNLSSSSSFSW